jgi:protein-S-isoprenylcysteine O-methyltransferase Ste14
MKCLFFTILAIALVSPVVAQGQSTFTTGDERHDVLFAVSVPNVESSPDDLYFHIAGPSDSSWIGFGFGERMKGALMLIVYTSGKNKSDVTISPRIARGNSEPIYNPDVVIEERASEIRKGRYSVTGKCRNCRTLMDKQYIDFASAAQPMIYAVGPERAHLSSDDMAAGLRRHDRYGRFTLNMTQAATGNLDPVAFPREGDVSNNGSAPVRDEKNDHDYRSYSHGILMIAVFVLLFPLGVVWLKIFESVRWHWINQLFGVGLLFIGAAVGINLSRQYNRSTNLNAPHQIIGLTVLGLALVQIGLGASHHIRFQRHQKRTILSILHRILGPILFPLGILNGGLGFWFASTPQHIIGYFVVILIVTFLYFGALFIHNRRRRRKAVYHTPAAQNFQSAYIAPQHQYDIPLAQGGSPPPYSRPAGS